MDDVRHRWYTPADCAAILHAMPQGKTWRASCPVHGGERNDTLSIREGIDKYGNPCTCLHCFAHDCAIEDICAAMGIEVRNLFAIHPVYAGKTQRHPRAHSPRIDRLKTMDTPTPDDIAQVMLEEMIITDPPFIQECYPARQALWKLAQDSPQKKALFTRALRDAGINVLLFWNNLASEMKD